MHRCVRDFGPDLLDALSSKIMGLYELAGCFRQIQFFEDRVLDDLLQATYFQKQKMRCIF